MAFRVLVTGILCSCVIVTAPGCSADIAVEASQIAQGSQDGPIITGPEIFLDEYRVSLLEKWAKMKPASVTGTTVNAKNWTFAIGNPANGLHATIAQSPALDTSVTLPHRILKPDWPLWYEKSIEVADYEWLYIDADDGAQVFQNGQLLNPVFGEFFSLLPAEDSSDKAATITVRVLNNAMRGGLEEAHLVAGPAFQTYQLYREQRTAMLRVIYDALRAPALNTDQKEALEAMLSLPSENSIASAAASFNSALRYPYLHELPTTVDDDGIFSFTAWGDSQAGWETFQKLVDQMAEIPSAFSIGLGDLVGYGSKEEEWLAFTVALQPLLKTQPVFPVAGNHDYDGYYNDLVPQLYYQYTREKETTASYFSWTYEGAFFLALDPNRNFPLQFEDEQVDWMLAAMDSEAWREANWRFILMHQTPFGQGWPGYHGDMFIRELVDSLAAPKEIDFVLTGHNHDYERLVVDYGGHKTNFFILGGAGGGLEPEESSAFPQMDLVIKAHHFSRFDIERHRVNVTVIGLDGQVLDKVLIQK
ncbi:MAG: metallophosphoesterase [Rhodothermales bacterium]